MFANEADYDRLDQGDALALPDIARHIADGSAIELADETKGLRIPLRCELSERDRAILLAGGLINYTRQGH